MSCTVRCEPSSVFRPASSEGEPIMNSPGGMYAKPEGVQSCGQLSIVSPADATQTPLPQGSCTYSTPPAAHNPWFPAASTAFP